MTIEKLPLNPTIDSCRLTYRYLEPHEYGKVKKGDRHIVEDHTADGTAKGNPQCFAEVVKIEKRFGMLRAEYKMIEDNNAKNN